MIVFIEDAVPATDPDYSSVVALLHLNATTLLTDQKGHSFTSTATFSGAQGPFGTGSYFFDGIDDKIQTSTTPTDWNFGSGDFTIEMWIRPASVTGFHELLATGSSLNGTNNGWVVLTNGTEVRFNYTTNGTTFVGSLDTSGAALALNTPAWIAVRRVSGVVDIYVNGVSKASATRNGTIFSSGTQLLSLGALPSGPTFYTGYQAELRITKGVGRTIVVPTAPFPDS